MSSARWTVLNGTLSGVVFFGIGIGTQAVAASLASNQSVSDWTRQTRDVQPTNTCPCGCGGALGARGRTGGGGRDGAAFFTLAAVAVVGCRRTATGRSGDCFARIMSLLLLLLLLMLVVVGGWRAVSCAPGRQAALLEYRRSIFCCVGGIHYRLAATGFHSK